MRKFKSFESGDKVRCMNPYWTLNGKDMFDVIYTVSQPERIIGSGCITIVEDSPQQRYTEREFELVEEASMSKLIDKQEHYKANGVEPIELMKQNFTKEEYSGFLQGNVLKYMMRFKKKNGVEDLKKALTYLTWLIEQEESK